MVRTPRPGLSFTSGSSSRASRDDPGSRRAGDDSHAYYYDVADLVTSKLEHRLYRRSGRAAILVSDIAFDDQGATQTGEITFFNGGKITLSAHTPVQFLTPLKLGGNVWQCTLAVRRRWATIAAFASIRPAGTPATSAAPGASTSASCLDLPTVLRSRFTPTRARSSRIATGRRTWSPAGDLLQAEQRRAQLGSRRSALDSLSSGTHPCTAHSPVGLTHLESSQRRVSRPGAVGTIGRPRECVKRVQPPEP